VPALLFYILLPFIYLISLLPFTILYILSDVLFFILYYITGYRKKIVMANLRNSFPKKDEAEIRRIARGYYRYFCDLLLEIAKTLTISRRSVKKRCGFSPEAQALFSKFAGERKSIILVLGHWGNWEWSGKSFTLLGMQQLYVIYHPLHNKYFDRLSSRMRRRFGTRIIAMKDTLREMIRRKEEFTATAFLADQTPPPEGAYWTTFLNQDTPVFNGTEKIARKLNFPVIYSRVKRIKRGYYIISAEVLSEEPAKTGAGELSEMHTRKLEADIVAMPETWLWSHRRWKHKKPAGGLLIN
jgi:KDO2-lipid IV(A) lauroyltransferase